MVKPGTACVEYVQCFDGQNMGDFECNGDTIFDQENQYCNWRSDVDCVDVETACPPSREPTTDIPTMPIAACPNPCPLGFSGFKTIPGSQCTKYVKCDNGEVAEELECFGDTIFNPNRQYCDWPHSYSCDPGTCPKREPTPAPVIQVGAQPQTPVMTTSVSFPDSPAPDIILESADCPNPCPFGFDGFKTRPGSQCKKYVHCLSGEVADELECYGDTIFNPNAQYCDWADSTRCSAVDCPKSEPTSSPVVSIALVAPEIPAIGISSTNAEPSTDTEFTTKDCSNPCLRNYSGLKTKPGTNCQAFAECENGEVVGEFVCYGDNYFVEESRSCVNVGVLIQGWSCPPVPCPTPAMAQFPTERPASTQQPSVSFRSPPTLTVKVAPPTKQPTPSPTPPPSSRPTRTPKPTRTRQPTTPRPTPMPLSTYQRFRTYLVEREDMIKSIVLQSNGKPSTAYTFPDFINSLDIAIFQFPADKAFFVGEGTNERHPKLSGVEYGLVNIALFMSNAMQEGIRIDSCDEWNTDFMFDDLREKYPLSNACGQYGRSYEDEGCHAMEPFQCALDRDMEITAVSSSADVNAPAFTCRPRMFNGMKEIFPGYYDAADDVVKQSAYSNTLGRTDIEGCCYWGRGVMLTRGRCSVGKLDKYIGQGAVDRGVYVYPDIDFCTNPEIICTHEKTNELRWVLGMLEWSDRVQSYVDMISGWKYLDQLKKFVDDGMVDDEFINAVIKIVTRNCHNDSCDDQWHLDEENNVFETSRWDNFHKIMFEIFNGPLTYHPTDRPDKSPSWSPTTWSPTHAPTFTVAQSPLHPTHIPGLWAEDSSPVGVHPTQTPGLLKEDDGPQRIHPTHTPGVWAEDSSPVGVHPTHTPGVWTEDGGPPRMHPTQKPIITEKPTRRKKIVKVVRGSLPQNPPSSSSAHRWRTYHLLFVLFSVVRTLSS